MSYLIREGEKMKLIKAHIYGFGKWVDYTIDFSREQFVCIYGLNESGKSTIHQFILFMLFGLPPRLRKFYRPKTSGKMGGQLIIFDENIGIYRIERIDEVDNGRARCYVGRQEYDEEWLSKQLKGLTKDIYHSIYSFSTLDLLHIEKMNDEDLGDILLGIGLTGSSQIQEIERRLEQRSGQLFKPYGKNPEINQQLTKVNELYTDLIEHQQLTKSYREKQQLATRLRQELTVLKKALETAKEKEFMLTKQQQVLPLIQRYNQLRQQLQTYPQHISFPERGLERLNILKEKMLPLQSEVAIIKENIAEARETLDELKAKLIDEQVLDQLKQLREHQHKYIENNKQMELLKQSANEQQWQIDQMLSTLQLNVTSEQLAELNLPFHLEQDWLNLKNNVERLKTDKEHLLAEQGALTEQQKQLEAELNSLQQERISDVQINEYQQRVRDYTSNEQLEELNRQSAHTLNIWQQKSRKKRKQLKYTFIGSVLGGLVSTSLAYFMSESWLYGVAMLFFIFGIGYWLLNQHSLKEINELIEQMNHRRRITSSVSLADKEEAEQILATQSKIKDQINGLQEQLKMIAIHLLQADEKLIVLQQHERRLQAQINEQIERHPFLQGIEVTYWPDLSQSLKQLIQMKQEQAQYMTTYEQIKQEQSSMSRLLVHLAEQVNIKHQELQISSLFDALQVCLQDQLNKRQSIQHQEQVMHEEQDHLNKLQEKMRHYETEMSYLFSLADVDSEEAFYQTANRFEQKASLTKEIQELKEQIVSLFPKTIWEKLLEDSVSQTEINLQIEKNREQIEELEEKIDNMRQQLAELKAEIGQLESSDAYSKTLHQFSIEKEQLRKLSIDWAVVKTAKEMLAQTKKRYRESYLTQVLEKTSGIFRHVTDGRYQKVYAPDEHHPFQVEAKDGMIYQVNELSRGTIDQLYISLRLAISEVMTEQHRLPFIIDDAFLNFDSRRLRRMIDILRNLSQKQQIILLTCRTSIAEQLQQEVKVIPLNPAIQIKA